MTKAKSEAAAPQPTFSEALEELEEILRRIEEEEIDIDDLAAEMRRTAELLELCRGKLRKAELEVTQIVHGLEAEEGPEKDGEAEDEEDEDIPF